MIFRNIFIKRDISKLIKLATTEIYSEKFEFNELKNMLAPSNNNIDLLKAFIAIQAVTKRVLPVDKSDFDLAIEEFISAEQLLIETKEYETILGLHQAKAEKGFLETKVYFTYGKNAYESNEYSYEGLKYKVEKIKKGPLTLEEHEKFKTLANQISETENKLAEIDELKSKEAANEAFMKIKEEVEKDKIKNKPKTKEELDKEYEELVKEFGKISKNKNKE